MSILKVGASDHFYRIGGLVVRVSADAPILESTFHPKLRQFRVEPNGSFDIWLRHHVSGAGPSLGRRKMPFGRGRHWRVYRDHGFWVYHRDEESGRALGRNLVAVFNDSHTRGRIYHAGATRFFDGGVASLSMMDSDQTFLARVLADRQGCILHAAGLIQDDRGLLFAGHSGAGKSTMMRMLEGEGDVLCDDRIIVRRGPAGFRLHGTWSHGTLPVVSAASAPLHAVFVLLQSNGNRAERMSDPRELARLLPSFLVKPVLTPRWWVAVMDLLQELIREVPVYRLHSDTSGAVKEIIRAI